VINSISFLSILTAWSVRSTYEPLLPPSFCFENSQLRATSRQDKPERSDSRCSANYKVESRTMLQWTLIFIVIAVIAELLGLSGVAGEAAWIAHVLFVIFLVLFIISLIFRGRPPAV
jgi:uncharacterized membrane protein YtjA (UPF0391 family)